MHRLALQGRSPWPASGSEDACGSPTLECGAVPQTLTQVHRGTAPADLVPFWSRYRYTRSTQFPPLHVVLAGMEERLLQRRLESLTVAVDGIAVSVFATTLLALRRRERWVRLGTDAPGRRRERYPEPLGR